MTPEDWIERCTGRLRELVLDMDVTLDDLAGAASDMIEESRYNKLAPDTAAELWARDTR